MAHKMAIVNDYIRADVIEANEFMDLVQRYRIRGVPRTIINERVQFDGPLPEGAFVGQVLSAVNDASAG